MKEIKTDNKGRGGQKQETHSKKKETPTVKEEATLSKKRTRSDQQMVVHNINSALFVFLPSFHRPFFRMNILPWFIRRVGIFPEVPDQQSLFSGLSPKNTTMLP